MKNLIVYVLLRGTFHEGYGIEEIFFSAELAIAKAEEIVKKENDSYLKDYVPDHEKDLIPLFERDSEREKDPVLYSADNEIDYVEVGKFEVKP